VPSVGDILEEAAGRFERRGISSPRLDAELLLAEAMGMDRSRLLARAAEEVPEAALPAFEAFARARESRKPVAYILGRREFWSMELHVSEAVLVPRPETELVVEACLDAPAGETPNLAVDVGTGSGAIALALARELPGTEIHATERSAAALAVARLNAERHDLASRIRFHEGDLLEPILSSGLSGRVGLIASNPPYVASGETVDEEVRLWEPAEAVFGGETGFEVIERLLPQASEALAPGGRLVMEMGPGQEARVVALLESAGAWEEVGVRKDLAGRPRVAMARRSVTER